MKKYRAQRSGRARRQTRRELAKRVAYRRSDSIVLYWQNGQLVFENFAARQRSAANPVVCSILHFCGESRTLPEIQSYLRKFDARSVSRLVKQLCGHELLQRTDLAEEPHEAAMRSWHEWNPAAGFFHFSTKDVAFAEDPWAAIREVQAKAKRDPMPLPVKDYKSAPRVVLPRIETEAELPRVLRARRTWRKYADEPVELAQLAAALELTFGIQGWAEIPGLGQAAMKTSPSGGGLHPIEAYVVAMRVRGLRRGIYHYNGSTHELEWLRRGVSRDDLKRDLGNQSWFSDAAFVVLMTAVFGRTQWKYDFARVYRGVLIEAGHLCQTFCLTATWLGLAPFSTIALADTKWESRLGIDGIHESVLYATGAGNRPADEKNAHIGTITAER